MTSIFIHTDFRACLKSWLEAKKREDPAFSLRVMAKKAGFKSAGHFSLVLNGKVNLSQKYLESLTASLGLNKKETEFFHALVLYTQARTHEEKKRNFERMASFSKSECKVIDVAQYEFFKHWYFTAVRELLAIHPFRGDFKALAKMVQPVITPLEAEKSIKLLLRLGMIKKSADGVYQKIDPALCTGYQTPTVAVSTFLSETIDLAKKSLYKTPRDERNISWATVSISEEQFKAIQEEIRAMRRKIIDISQCDDNPERVYHFGFQLFPLSRAGKKETA